MATLYNIEWLDEYGSVYDSLEHAFKEEVTHFKRDAKCCHLCIRITNLTTNKATIYNHLDAELYAEK
jgi:hypothetical protein